jgi:hypothetical protein
VSEQRGRRRHRRVDAPPTNPDADRTEDESPAGPPPEAAGASPGEEDASDAWYHEQRPPHWG